MTIKFDTIEYEFSYCHTPRGRGSWAFRFDSPNADPWWAVAPNGSASMAYAEARKLARTEAARRGATVVYVCT